MLRSIALLISLGSEMISLFAYMQKVPVAVHTTNTLQ